MSQLPAKRKGALLAYVVWVPPKEKLVLLPADIYKKIWFDCYLKNKEPVFANLTLVTAEDISSDEFDLCISGFTEELKQGMYTEIQFYGGSVTEVVRRIVYLASVHRVRIVDWSDPGSILQRYLQWFFTDEP